LFSIIFNKTSSILVKFFALKPLDMLKWAAR
jgi:hypothetical protein